MNNNLDVKYSNLAEKYNHDVAITNLLNGIWNSGKSAEDIIGLNVTFNGEKWSVAGKEIDLNQKASLLFIKRPVHWIRQKMSSKYTEAFNASISKANAAFNTFKDDCTKKVEADKQAQKLAAEQDAIKQKVDGLNSQIAIKATMLTKLKDEMKGFEDKINESSKNLTEEQDQLKTKSESDIRETKSALNELQVLKTALNSYKSLNGNIITKLLHNPNETKLLKEAKETLIKKGDFKKELSKVTEQELAGKLTATELMFNAKAEVLKQLETTLEQITSQKHPKLEPIQADIDSNKTHLATAKGEIGKLEGEIEKLKQEIQTLTGSASQETKQPEKSEENANVEPQAQPVAAPKEAAAKTEKNLTLEVIGKMKEIAGEQLMGTLEILFKKVNEDLVTDFKSVGKDKYEIKLKRPIRMLVQSPKGYEGGPRGGTILLLGDNNDNKIVLNITKNMIKPEAGFEAFCRIPKKYEGVAPKSLEFVKATVYKLNSLQDNGIEKISCEAGAKVKLGFINIEKKETRVLGLNDQRAVWEEGELLEPKVKMTDEDYKAFIRRKAP